MQAIVLTVVAMTAFAANSVLCRMALGDIKIDAASFSTIRLLSGALTLLLLTRVPSPRAVRGQGGSWLSGFMLFLYAMPFSYAYLSLGAGTGALILFGAVQATMIVAAIAGGERPGTLEWAGLMLAIGGLIYLVSPGLTAPSPLGSGLMVVSGLAWGIYSLRGKGAADAIAATTDNFVRSLPFVFVVSAITIRRTDMSLAGFMLACASGALASGLGYVIWYAALRHLTSTRAAIVQLSVPAIAALGGVLFLAESVSLRLVVSALLILGGVGLAVAQPRQQQTTAGSAAGI
jgi:drug/metabolite transporter (DMT)-like permease